MDFGDRVDDNEGRRPRMFDQRSTGQHLAYSHAGTGVSSRNPRPRRTKPGEIEVGGKAEDLRFASRSRCAASFCCRECQGQTQK